MPHKIRALKHTRYPQLPQVVQRDGVPISRLQRCGVSEEYVLGESYCPNTQSPFCNAQFPLNGGTITPVRQRYPLSLNELVLSPVRLGIDIPQCLPQTGILIGQECPALLFLQLLRRHPVPVLWLTQWRVE